MNEFLDVTVQIVTVAGFLSAAFSFAVLRPLNNSIVRLESAIAEFRADMRQNREQIHHMETRIAEVDMRAQAAHRRLDEMNGGGHHD